MAHPHYHGGDANVCTNEDLDMTVQWADDRKPVDQAHEMTLDERRSLVIKDIVNDEENFEPGTLSALLLAYRKWLYTNTDTFDPVVVRAQMDMADEARGELDRSSLLMDDDLIREEILGFLFMRVD